MIILFGVLGYSPGVLNPPYTKNSLEWWLLFIFNSIVEDLKRGWTRFEFVTTATKQLTVIPTLLRGKLIDYYMELENDVKGDLKLLRTALEDRAGKKEDPLIASKNFNQCNQGQGEKVTDFTSFL